MLNCIVIDQIVSQVEHPEIAEDWAAWTSCMDCVDKYAGPVGPEVVGRECKLLEARHRAELQRRRNRRGSLVAHVGWLQMEFGARIQLPIHHVRRLKSGAQLIASVRRVRIQQQQQISDVGADFRKRARIAEPVWQHRHLQRVGAFAKGHRANQTVLGWRWEALVERVVLAVVVDVHKAAVVDQLLLEILRLLIRLLRKPLAELRVSCDAAIVNARVVCVGRALQRRASRDGIRHREARLVAGVVGAGRVAWRAWVGVVVARALVHQVRVQARVDVAE
mmetsp:Transcript_8278/g.19846  ORF Transcript_8278/g.19846 Transcript_8278/m.19846 type:complete len:278 (+) Transcript_8278:531-1364(+)